MCGYICAHELDEFVGKRAVFSAGFVAMDSKTTAYTFEMVLGEVNQICIHS